MPHKLTPGQLAWVGLASYVTLYDVPALIIKNRQIERTGSSDIDLMTEAWREALHHPKRRWIVIGCWAFTTKHLFFGEFLPWLDPFVIIGIAAEAVDQLLRLGDRK